MSKIYVFILFISLFNACATKAPKFGNAEVLKKWRIWSTCTDCFNSKIQVPFAETTAAGKATSSSNTDLKNEVKDSSSDDDITQDIGCVQDYDRQNWKKLKNRRLKRKVKPKGWFFASNDCHDHHLEWRQIRWISRCITIDFICSGDFGT